MHQDKRGGGGRMDEIEKDRGKWDRENETNKRGWSKEAKGKKSRKYPFASIHKINQMQTWFPSVLFALSKHYIFPNRATKK